MNGPAPRPADRPDPASGYLPGSASPRLAAPPDEAGRRAAPDRRRIARRRRLVRGSKLLLPVAALALLGSLALWPEIERAIRVGRSALRAATALHASSGLMTSLTYRGIDRRGRPYMITAVAAHQVSPERVDLTRPKADIFSGSGAWLMLTADRGVYFTKPQILDLSGHVVLYRDDGTFVTAPVATIDVRQGIDAANAWVHVEGPFGVLDAASYLLASHDGILQFHGPARLVLNETRGRP